MLARGREDSIVIPIIPFIDLPADIYIYYYTYIYPIAFERTLLKSGRLEPTFLTSVLPNPEHRSTQRDVVLSD